jgi:shikimate dehydrogenase
MRKYGLIGESLEHSFSPMYFARKFQAENISDADYQAYPLAHLEGFRQWFQESGLSGANVTIPYKEAILAHLDRLSPEAASIGAVNCIALEGNELVGYNTDADGFARAVVPFIENKFERALILGTGGASKAIAYALSSWGMDVIFATRQPQQSNHLSYDALNAANMSFFPLIVNCTSLGTWPNTDQCPDIPFEGLTPQHFCVDLVYNPPVTRFMRNAQQYGAMVMNGQKMLEIQAELSWQIWQQTASSVAS